MEHPIHTESKHLALLRRKFAKPAPKNGIFQTRQNFRQQRLKKIQPTSNHA